VDLAVSLSPDRLALLEESGSALLETSEPETVAKVALGTVVPALAEMAVLVVCDHSGFRHITAAHARQDAGAGLEREVRSALDAIVATAAASARQGRYARWVPSVTPASMRLLTRGDRRLVSLIRAVELRSLIVVALRTGGRTFGALALGRSEAAEPFRSGDFATAQVLARRVALAVQRAMMDDPGAVERWRAVFDAAWWGAAVVDAADHRVEAVNQAFARLVGEDPSSLLGRPISELLPQDETEEPEPWGVGLEARVYESEVRRPDGVAAPVLVNVTPLDETDAGSLVVTVQDLSDLKRAEERLRRAQRMEAVGRLAGGVAHEVNNMMTIILGFSDLLSRGSDGGGDPREVEEIRKAAMRAARITSQLLAFSRQQVLQPADQRLNAVVEQMAPVLRLMLPANVRVETSLAPFDAVVRADRSQLEQVLINLAFNARDAMTAGGTIRIATGSRRLDEETGRRLIGIPIPEGSYGLISVVDTGHGMDRTTLAHVFEPFFTTKPVGSGTGLGLSTVYGIVKQSGGYVWADSSPGQGTAFTICLPEVSGGAREQPATVAKPASLPARGETVLVLEDEDAVRELTARVLRDRGYEVVLARNGAEALVRLRNRGNQPDLLLTDVVVPDMGTEELEGEVHRLHPALPILYMSGYPRDDILARGLLRGEQPFLQKPFTNEDLAQEVGRMVRRA
jgi:two-component system cell cycle sensor histidine kinase/response regulator CckA